MTDVAGIAGIEKPFDALKHARALAQAGQAASAVEFLRQRRNEWNSVPANYDLTLGLLQLRIGEAAAALDTLLIARSRFGAEIPAALHRGLGGAYLALGRPECAGRELSLLQEGPDLELRRPERLAVAAYQSRTQEEPDTGAPTPYAILLRAETLAGENDAAEAFKLLNKHRKNWGDLPSEYDMALRRLRNETVDRNDEVDRLVARRQAAGSEADASLQQALGTALFEVGRVREAGAELHAALAKGARISRLDLLLAVNAYRLAHDCGPMIDTSFGRNATLVDPQKRIAYVAVPKNASSLLKSLFVMNSGYREEFVASSTPIHDFCDMVSSRAAANEDARHGEYFRFTLLRDPARRLLSAYLDKFVRGHRSRQPQLRAQQMVATIRAAQALGGISFDADRSITFEEFVRYLAHADDAEFNMHWMPQWRIVGRDLSVYHHVGLVERLQVTLDLLTSRFGYSQNVDLAATLPNARTHIAKHSAQSEVEEPFRMLPAELAGHGERLPLASKFLTPELRGLVARRYEADMILYQAAAASVAA